MSKLNIDLLAFNRGLVSPLALARVDVERTRLSADTQINWLSKTQGAMRLRPGGKYLGSSINDTGAQWVEFVASTTDVALLELTKNKMRVWISDALLVRPAAAAITDFATDTGQWQDKSSGGGYVAFGDSGSVSGDTGLILNAINIGGIAKATRKVALADTGEINVEHGLKIHVVRGPVTFRVGNDTGDETYIKQTTLYTGWHHLAFTPTAAEYHLTFQSEEGVVRIVASIAADTGTVEVTTPWDADDIDNVRVDQSADVVFAACKDVKQQRIERRGTGRSWSVVDYYVTNGPFLPAPSSTAKLKPGATFGNTTLTANQAFFKSTHVGALFRITHSGQNGTYRMGRAGIHSDTWTVTGINASAPVPDERAFVVVTTGTFTADLRVVRSFDDPEFGFRTTNTITTATSTSVSDPDDNTIAYYRLEINDTGDYTSGTVVASVAYEGGTKTGICRVTKYVSPTSVQVEVLSRFGATTYSDDWVEGYWSDAQSWPTAVALHEGRLWWFGGTQMFGSVSDDYSNFDDTTEGDAGPIVRSIGRGPVDSVKFALPLLRLMVGTAGQEIGIRSSSFEEPLTPENTNAKTSSTQGSAGLRALILDATGVFVQRSGKRVYLLNFDINKGDYSAQELTLLVPDLLAEGVVSLAIQRQPDTRIYFVLGDGTVAILTYEEAESVLCWSLYQSTAASGAVEKVSVLPGADEDQVYFHVRRTINGATKRYLEKQAMESEAPGDTGVSWMADCAIKVTQASSTTVSGLSHLQGQSVIVANTDTGATLSQDDTGGTQAVYTVAAGAITLPVAVTRVMVGLPYLDKATDEFSAKYKTTKLAYGAVMGTALTQVKRVDHLGFVLGPTHNNGVYFGNAFDDMKPLPRRIKERPVTDSGEVFTALDLEATEFAGKFDTDARVCITAKAPRIATVMAGIVGIVTHDK